jgi:hypothetical protein
MDWLDPLLRGLAALVLAAAMFVAARIRFGRRERGDAGDVGLD